MDLLTRLRSKSPLVRAQYALGIAAVVTGVIALIWLSALPARFAELNEPETVTPTLRTAPVEQIPEEEPVYQGATEGLEALGEAQIESMSTSTTAQGTSNNASGSRAIQIATTSQNRN